MCWTSYNTPVKQITDDDNICYKIFAKKDIKWDKNKIKELSSICTKYLYTPHSLNPRVNIYYTWNTIYNAWCINKGYHSFASLSIAKGYISNKFCIIECTIPKNSFYYVNSRGEIVSSNIIVTDKIIE